MFNNLRPDDDVPFLESHAFGDFAIGTIQGIAFALCGQPFDAVRLNSQAGNLRGILNERCTTREVARHLYRTDGLRGFWQGWSFPAFGFTLGRAVQQMTMNLCRDYFILQQRADFEELRRREEQRLMQLEAERERNLPWYASTVRALGSTKLMELTGVERRDAAQLLQNSGIVAGNFGSRMQNDMQLAPWKNVVCATIGAVAYTTIHTPFDMVRVRMLTQNQYPHRLYHNSIDCAWKLYECGGIEKLYLGYKAALARDIPAQIITFGLYGILRPLLPQDKNTKAVQARYGVLLGGIVGMVQWTVVIPFDCIKTRIQTAPEDMHLKPTWLEAGKRIYVLYGVRGFYVGLPAALMKAFVGNAALFASMEMAASHVDAFQRACAEERLANASRTGGGAGGGPIRV